MHPDDRNRNWPETWITHEWPPRKLIVKGRAAIDIDCLVAHVEGQTRPLWIVDGGPNGKTVGVFVTGIDVLASRVEQPAHG